MATTWTDYPATSGTHIRTVHINELRNVVDQNRSAAGLGGYPWTDNPVATSTHIRGVHFTELRNAIQDLWNHQGMGTLPNWSVGSAPAPNRQISARDINDLRNWVDQYEAAAGTSYDPPPMSTQFGVDTASSLATVTWSAVQAWKGVYPSYAGRYFGSGNLWQSGEGQAAKVATGGVLNKIAPLQSQPGPPNPNPNNYLSREEVPGSAGFSYGVADATETCNNIIGALQAGELSLPGDFVRVYLDVEQGTNLTVDYWAGWAHTIFKCTYNGLEPLYPAIYCNFVLSNGLFIPNTVIQYVLNNACGQYPDYEVICYGLWTNQPEPCTNCAPNPSLDWAQFGTYAQPCHDAFFGVPVLLWQYAEVGCRDVQGCNSGHQYDNFAGGQNLDVDDSDSTTAQQYMLVIN